MHSWDWFLVLAFGVEVECALLVSVLGVLLVLLIDLVAGLLEFVIPVVEDLLETVWLLAVAVTLEGIKDFW